MLLVHAYNMILCYLFITLLTLLHNTIAIHNTPVPTYSVNYTYYHTYNAYEQKLQYYAKTYKNILKLHKYPQYHANNLPIYHIILTTKSHYNQIGTLKPKILLSAGEHARELITVESMLDFIDNITIGYTQSDCNTYSTQLASFILHNFELHILPLVNPSGKVYLEQTKNMCYRNNYPNGIDFNRNFPWQYGGPGSTNTTYSEEYRGQYVFQSIEAQFLQYLALTYKYTAYMSIHSGTKQLFVPFVDTESKRIQRTRPTTALELRIAEYIYTHTDRWYHNYGIAYNMNDYGADGTAMDYMAGIHNVTYVYTTEIYGIDHTNCFVQFNSAGETLQENLDRIRLTYIRLLEAVATVELNGVVVPTVENVYSEYNVKICQLYNTMDALATEMQSVAK